MLRSAASLQSAAFRRSLVTAARRTRVDVCICRDREEALSQALESEALVVMGGRPVTVPREGFGGKIAKQWPSRDSYRLGAKQMTDIFFVLVGILFFVAAWAFTKACDKL